MFKNCPKRSVLVAAETGRNSAVLELGGTAALEGVDITVGGEADGIPETEGRLRRTGFEVMRLPAVPGKPSYLEKLIFLLDLS